MELSSSNFKGQNWSS